MLGTGQNPLCEPRNLLLEVTCGSRGSVVHNQRGLARPVGRCEEMWLWSWIASLLQALGLSSKEAKIVILGARRTEAQLKEFKHNGARPVHLIITMIKWTRTTGRAS